MQLQSTNQEIVPGSHAILSRPTINDTTATEPNKTGAPATTEAVNFLSDISKDPVASLRLDDAFSRLLDAIHVKNLDGENRRIFLQQLTDSALGVDDIINPCLTNSDVSTIKSAAYSLLRESDAEKTLASTLEHTRALDGFPSDELWRLVICGRKQNDSPNAKYVYENEPGYLAGGLSGWSEMLKTLDKPLDTELLISLHDACVDGVMERNSGFPAAKMSKGIDGGVALFGGEQGNNVTLDGLEEMLEEKLPDSQSCLMLNYANEDKTIFEIEGKGDQGRFEKFDELKSGRSFDRFAFGSDQILLGRPEDSDFESCKTACQSIIARYSERIRDAGGDEGKILSAIASACRSLENEHVFEDGNARTIGNLVLNKLLIQNNLSPCIFPDPNLFDGHTINELCKNIKKGQDSFNNLKR